MSAFLSVLQNRTIEMIRKEKYLDQNVRIIDDKDEITLKFFKKGCEFPVLQIDIAEHNGLKSASIRTYKGIHLRKAEYVTPEYDLNVFLRRYINQLVATLKERA